MQNIKDLSDGSNNLSRIKFWKIKNKICPKTQPSLPVAKMDECGKLISSKRELKKLEVRNYKHRLRSRSIKSICQLENIERESVLCEISAI